MYINIYMFILYSILFLWATYCIIFMLDYRLYYFASTKSRCEAFRKAFRNAFRKAFRKSILRTSDVWGKPTPSHGCCEDFAEGV